MLAVHSSKMPVSMRRMLLACTVMSVLLSLSLLPVEAQQEEMGSGSGFMDDMDMAGNMSTSVSLDASPTQVLTIISETSTTDMEPTPVSSESSGTVLPPLTAMTTSASPTTSVSLDASTTQSVMVSSAMFTTDIEPTSVSSATGTAVSPTTSDPPSTPLSTTGIPPVTTQMAFSQTILPTTSEVESGPTSSNQVGAFITPNLATTIAPSTSVQTSSTIAVSATTDREIVDTTTVQPTTMATTEAEPTTTMTTTEIETTEQTTAMTATDTISTTDTGTGAQSTTDEETEAATTTVAPGMSEGLSTTDQLVIALAAVLFLIILFAVLICVFIGLLCRNKRKGQDSFKREILNNWEIKDSPSHGGVHLMKIRTLDEVSGSADDRDGDEPLNLAARRVKAKGNEYELTNISEGRGATASTLDERSPDAKTKGNVASYFGIPTLQDNALSNTVTTFGVTTQANTTSPSSAGPAKSAEKSVEVKKPTEAQASADITRSGSDGNAVNQSERNLTTVEASGSKSTSGVVVPESTTNVKESVSTFTTFKLPPSTKETAESAHIQDGGKVNGDTASPHHRETDQQPSLKLLSMSPSKQRTKVDQGSLSSEDVERALGGVTGDLGLEVSTQL